MKHAGEHIGTFSTFSGQLASSVQFPFKLKFNLKQYICYNKAVIWKAPLQLGATLRLWTVSVTFDNDINYHISPTSLSPTITVTCIAPCTKTQPRQVKYHNI